MATFQTLGELSSSLTTRSTAPGGEPLWVADPGVPLTDLTQVRDDVWRTQPSVRKVIDFIARELASIPLHAYERVADEDRRRVRDRPIARLVARPSRARGMTAFRFWHSTLADWMIYDRWAALKVTDGGEMELRRIPARRFRFVTDGLEQVTGLRVWRADGTTKVYDPSAFVFDTGYGGHGGGTSPMTTIAHLLQEQAEAVAYRRQVWANGARVPMVITRPIAWKNDEARERFTNSWRNFTRDGGRSGGTPVLEDGMDVKKVEAFNPQEAQDLEGRRLTDIEVAAFFHIAPELVGARQGNYSNVDAFRQMLYGPSLGPYAEAWQQAVDVGVTEDLEPTGRIYVEVNLQSKLRGSFIEQAQVLQSSVGAPWMLRNEARARMNMPAIDGGDEVVTPLNVLIGGQASARDAGSQNLGQNGDGSLARHVDSKGVHVKARPPAGTQTRAEQVLQAFFRRQAAVVRTALGAKADGDWWDADRWDAELGADLYGVAVAVSEQVGRATLETVGVEPDEYAVDRTLAFLTAVSTRIAGGLNAATKAQLDEALAMDEPSEEVARVFDVAQSSRAGQTAMTAVTGFAGFGTTEAARQVGGGTVTKTWLVTSRNPRASHAAMNGQTVGIDETFSNGASWPADAALSVDEISGCQCDVQVNFE